MNGKLCGKSNNNNLNKYIVMKNSVCNLVRGQKHKFFLLHLNIIDQSYLLDV